MNLPENLEKRFRIAELVLLALTVLVAVYVYFATRDQVKVSRDQVEVATFANKKELRPYLYVTRTDDSLVAKGKIIPEKRIYPRDIGCYIKNSGQTPAYNVRYVGAVQVIDTLISDPNDLDTAKAGFLPVMGSGAELYIYFQVEQKNPLSVVTNPYLFGKITYEDTFHEKHKMTFSYRYIYGVGFIRDVFRPIPEAYNRELY